MNILERTRTEYSWIGFKIREDTIYIDQVDGSRTFIIRAGLDRIPIGFMAINDKDEGEGLYIAPKFRGRHLAQDLLSLARDKGMKEVHVHEKNKPSLKLCKKMGFELICWFNVKTEMFAQFRVQ
jgi:RimJ/RimL family protein N-acetyltransferase